MHCMDIADEEGYKLALFSYSLGVPEWEEMEAILTRHGLRFEAYDGNSLQEPEAGAMRLLYVCQRA